MRTATGAIALLVLMGAAQARKKAQPTLSDRYQTAACAVVQITSGQEAGTGFFVSPDGDVVTAAHVALDRTFSEPEPGKIQMDVDYKPGLQIHGISGDVKPLTHLPKLSPADGLRARSDLAILKTGLPTPCFLKLGGHTAGVAIGQHLIAVGFPESAADRALYEGIASARYKHLPLAMAIVNGKPIYPDYDVLRIQMPLTPGVSGGPVIADDGDIVGVMVENPTEWFDDLNKLIAYEQIRSDGCGAPQSDLSSMVAKLAWVVRDFVSSGAGLAVPTSYLDVEEQKPAEMQR